MSLYDDITDRKRAEIGLRKSEERQAFLLQLSDALRSLEAAAEIQGEATRLLREHLAAGWCYYVEWDEAAARGVVLRDATRDGLPSLAGTHDVSDVPSFLDILRTVSVLNVRDYASFDELSPELRARYTALGFRSMLVATLVKQGWLVASLIVGDTEVRDWSGDAETLLMEVAERTWAAVERARAEAALRASEERYRSLVENVRDYAIFRVDPDGVITEWPNGAERVNGYTAREVIGKSVSILYTPEDVAAGVVEGEIAEAAKTGHVEREGWRLRKGGKRFWVNVIMTAIHDGEGRLVGFTKVARDLTESRRAEEAAERERANRARDELRRQLAAAEEAERRRLARELHDQLGQQLTGLALGLEDARRLVVVANGAQNGGASPLARRLDQLQALAREVTMGARYIALELRPPELDDMGFEDALGTYVREWSARFGIPFEFEITGQARGMLPVNISSALYRIAQEALTNVAKHADATQVSVIVSYSDGEARLIIEDDGRGFDMDATARRVQSERRLGLAGMRERAALVGGEVRIESSPGRGAAVFVRMRHGSLESSAHQEMLSDTSSKGSSFL